MRKDYQIICLDSSDKPKQVATIEANSPSKGEACGSTACD